MVIVESILILILAGVLSAGVSPNILRHLAALLIAHAEALESFKRARVEALHHWRPRLGLSGSRVEDVRLEVRR